MNAIVKRRTGGMTVVATLDVIFGICGAMLALGGIVAALNGARRAVVIEGSMGIAGITGSQQTFAAYLLGMSSLSLLIGLVAVLAGIALFRLWRWAPALNLTYAAVAATRCLILFLFPALTPTQSTATPSLSNRIIGLCLGLLYPIILVLLFSKSRWRGLLSQRDTI